MMPTRIERGGSDSDYGFFFEPAVAEGTVYAKAEITRTPERSLVAFDVQTGRERWRLMEVAFLTSPPSIPGDAPYIGSADGVLAVDAATGTPRWVVPAMPMTTMSVVVGGRVYATGPGTLIAHADSTTGP